MLINKPTKANPLWILISAIPLGSVISMLYVLSSRRNNKEYSLFFLIPVIGPLIAYVMMESKDTYLASMAEWVFIGEIIDTIIWLVARAALLSIVY